jgi:hypothetical protein
MNAEKPKRIAQSPEVRLFSDVFRALNQTFKNTLRIAEASTSIGGAGFSNLSCRVLRSSAPGFAIAADSGPNRLELL